jgi:hypothetical protein
LKYNIANMKDPIQKIQDPKANHTNAKRKSTMTESEDTTTTKDKSVTTSAQEDEAPPPSKKIKADDDDAGPMEQAPDSEWPEAWLMPQGECVDQKAPNKLDPNVPVTVEEMKALGIW